VDELVGAISPEDYDEVTVTLTKLTQAVRDIEQPQIK
jgi:hypothetical protein